MEWTTEIPTIFGFYWVIDYEGNVGLVKISSEHSPMGKSFEALMDADTWQSLDRFYAFMGPLSIPEPPPLPEKEPA